MDWPDKNPCDGHIFEYKVHCDILYIEVFQRKKELQSTELGKYRSEIIYTDSLRFKTKFRIGGFFYV